MASSFVIVGALALALAGHGTAPVNTKPKPPVLTMGNRVAARAAVERVLWKHRIWPEQNGGPKPPFSAALSEEAIRAKVETALAESNALGVLWNRPITREQLQAELERMASHTQDPEMLQEMFHALGDDALVISETLARPALADRLVRNWYANDARFHAAERQSAEDARVQCDHLSCLVSRGGRLTETVLRHRGSRAAHTRAALAAEEIALGEKEWNAQLSRIATQFRTRSAALPIGRLSRVEETPDAFLVTAVLEQSSDAIRIATVSWPKRSFEDWWAEEVQAIPPGVDVAPGPRTLPTIRVGRCTRGRWQPTWSDAPDGRTDHSAVWTGTEMIVWGGYVIGGEVLGVVNTGGRYDPATDTWSPTSTGPNCPSRRRGHSAIWTGTEMIVWGGGTTGGRYDPATDSWRPIVANPDIPLATGRSSVIWTGERMIVWGGYLYDSGDRYVNLGGIYDPATDSWRPTSTVAGVPSGRAGHTAVWTGSEMIVWGGGSGSSILRDGARYDPARDAWRPVSDLGAPSARALHTAVWTGSEMIVWGGGSGSSMLGDGARYDPAHDAWRAVSEVDAPSARSRHTAVWTGTEMIVWGEADDGSGGRYDPARDTWRPTSTSGNAPGERSGHTAVWTGAEMIVWGGALRQALNTGGRYSPVSDSWVPTSTGGATPAARYDHASVWTGAELIVWGGIGYEYGELNSGGRYVPATDTWRAMSASGEVPSPRARHTEVWTGREMVMWGGVDRHAPGRYLDSGGRYDPARDSWRATSLGTGVPSARAYHTAVWTGREMIVWGGYADPGGWLDSGSGYDPASDAWSPMAMGGAAPSPRGFHSAVWTGTEMIVWGGFESAEGALSTGARYSPESDTWAPTSTGPGTPGPRESLVAVWTGTEMIVWGGERRSDTFNNGARYRPDTDTWTPMAAEQLLPGGRAYHTAVWTGTEMIVWGGYRYVSSAGVLGTGLRYDPAADAWTLTPMDADVPAPRVSHTATWAGNRMIVWGGDPLTATGASLCVPPPHGPHAGPGGTLRGRDALDSAAP